MYIHFFECIEKILNAPDPSIAAGELEKMDALYASTNNDTLNVWFWETR